MRFGTYGSAGSPAFSSFSGSLLVIVVFSFVIPAAQPRIGHAGETARLLKLGGKPTYVHGINLTWLNGACGHDFGELPAHPDWEVAFSRNDLACAFDNMAGMHLNAVRIWVFEDMEGVRFNDQGYAEGIEPRFIDNFSVALSLANDRGLHLYLTLSNNVMRTCRLLGVKDVVVDGDARRRYLDKVIKPFVTRFKGDTAIFAYDIMNEPEWEVAGRTGNWTAEGYSWAVIRNFIRDNARVIHGADPGRLVSCGSGWHSFENIKAGIYSGLGLDFYDFHEYRNDGYLPPVKDLGLDRPVLIGEFNQDNQKEVEDDELQRRAVEAFLRNARDGGYAGAFFWNYDHPNAPGVAFLRILRGRGSGELRPAAAALRDFRTEGSPAIQPPRNGARPIGTSPTSRTRTPYRSTQSTSPSSLPMSEFRLATFFVKNRGMNQVLTGRLKEDGTYELSDGNTGDWHMEGRVFVATSKTYGVARLRPTGSGVYRCTLADPGTGEKINVVVTRLK